MKNVTSLFLFALFTLTSFPAFSKEALTVAEKQSRVAFNPRGPRGLFRLFSAETPEHGPMALGFGIHADYMGLKDFPANGSEIERIRGRASLSWTPVSFLELFVNSSALTSNDADDSILVQQVGNTGFGFKWAETLNPLLSLGVVYEGELMRPLYDKGGTRYALSHTGYFVNTFNFDSPFKLHVNVGYRRDDSQDLAYAGINERDQVILEILGRHAIVGGIGFEVPVSQVNLSLEYTTEQTLKSAGIGYLDNPQRVTAGLRYFPSSNPHLSFGLAGNVGMFATRDTNRVYKEPDYSFMASVSYFLGKHVEEVTQPAPVQPTTKYTTLAGKVKDAKSGASVSGAHMVLCQSSISPIVSESGEYRSYPIPEGECAVKVTHPEYVPYEAKLTLSGLEQVQDFIIERASPPQGFLAVSIRDIDGKPIAGEVVFPEIPAAQIVKTNDQGKVRMKLPEGKYLVEVRAKGKKPEQKIFEMAGNQETAAEYILANGNARLEDKRIVITRQVQFEAGKATLKDDSKTILDEVAAILTEHTEIKKLEIGGHTDATGIAVNNKRLSQRRAQAVLNYLVSVGVSKLRLSAVGYGQTQPIATNATSEGRLANRRVEFKVISN